MIAQRLAALFLLIVLAPCAFARDSVPPQWETVYDFLVQDVCVDAADVLKVGISPADGPERCPLRRNLKIGELLPYHKHDWPSATDRNNPQGYHRSNNIPVRTRLFGTAVMQTRAFAGGDKSFGRLSFNQQGGDIYLFSDQSVAIGATQDPSGVQIFYGPRCSNRDSPSRVLDSWIIVDRSFSLIQPGSTVARLTRDTSRCWNPDHAFTSWKVKTVEFRTSAGPRSMNTLISDHFGGSSREAADHLERFYYTREFGLLRWERWENLAGREQATHLRKAENLAASGRCDPVQEAPSNRGRWVFTACRQWTNIVPAHSDKGDPLPLWVQRIRAEPKTGGIFVE